MAKSRLADFVISHQVNSIEEVKICLSKVKALLDIILGKELSDVSQVTLHEYLTVLSDYVEQAFYMNETALTLLWNLSKHKT